jgi:uncharacterized membrane protein (UPF0127 family)
MKSEAPNRSATKSSHRGWLPGRSWTWVHAGLIALLSLTGCGPSATDAARPTNPAPAAPGSALRNHGFLQPLTNAQPRLTTVKLWLGSIELETEVAARPIEILTGMMYRKKMEETEGMIFVLPDSPRQASFWMKNTKVPLSCAYIDAAGKILETHNLNPFDENPVASATDQICYVLEVPQGWFQRKKIEVGALVRSDRGSLQETFHRR